MYKTYWEMGRNCSCGERNKGEEQRKRDKRKTEQKEKMETAFVNKEGEEQLREWEKKRKISCTGTNPYVEYDCYGYLKYTSKKFKNT